MPYDVHRVSPNQRLHWRTLNGRKRALKTAALYAWQMAGSPRVTVPVRISFILRRGRRIDPDNAVACMKSLLDGLTFDRKLKQSRMLEDDRAEFISIGQVRQECKPFWKGQEQVEVWIEPRETP